MHPLKDASKPAVNRAVVLLVALLVSLVATASAVAAPEEGEGSPEPPRLVFEPDRYDFGLQPLNWGAQQTTFQLRNAGSEAFQVGSPQIGGSGSSAFWTGNSNCYGATLQPGDACYAQVYFGPYDTDEYTAQFSVNVGSYSFAADLSGTGGRAIFTPAAATTDFGVAEVGSPGAVREISISNTGNMPGGVFIAVIAGGAIGSFQILDENCTGIELLPAATCTLQVRFQPVSEGVKKAMLGLFGDNDGPTPIVLTGVGAAAEPASVAAASPPGQVSGEKRAKRIRRSRSLRGAKWHRIAVRDARLASKMR